MVACFVTTRWMAKKNLLKLTAGRVSVAVANSSDRGLVSKGKILRQSLPNGAYL